jgi:hypothetical protein
MSRFRTRRQLINDFKQYFVKYNKVVYENPPGLKPRYLHPCGQSLGVPERRQAMIPMFLVMETE